MATPLEMWVEESARLTKPDRIVYCDGSEAENRRILDEMLHGTDSVTLNEKTYPNCYLHRSNPNDVARTEHLTFICAPEKEDAGPTNNWMAPAEAKENRRAVRWRDGRADDVRGALHDGAGGFADQQGGRGSYRQPVRGGEHADHVAHGQSGAGRIGNTRRFCAGAAFAGRSGSRRGDSSRTSPKKN